MRFLVPAAIVMCLAGCCYYSSRTTIRPCPPPGSGPTGEPTVRVRLTAGIITVLSSSRGLTLASGSSRQSVGPNQSIRVRLEGGLVVATGCPSTLRTVDTLVVSAGEGGLAVPVGQFVRVGDRSYRGRVLLFRSADGDLAVINVLGIEEYLLGVVPCEIGPINARTLEAAKAQAVAARSFTMTRLGRRKGLGHDLFDSYLRDQEYRGIERETELSRQAVSATRGEVLEFKDEVCEALYHGNCGGVTANGSKPYLKSVPDTPEHRRGRNAYCSDRPNSSWQTSLGKESLDAVASRLSAKPCHVRGGKLEIDGSGRVKYVDLTTDRGSLRLPGSDFRMGMGLKSTAFTMTIRSRYVVIAGHGWGHGAGMCQDGAVAMAEAGASYPEILQQYYSGVSLRKRY